MKITKYFNKMIVKISSILAELCIVLGLFFIVYTTFTINYRYGMYLSGFILLIVGVLLAMERK